MGYCITYQTKIKKNGTFGRMIRLFLLTGLCFAAFYYGVHNLWPEGEAVLQKLFVHSGKSVAVSALNIFADELMVGKSPVTAFSEFLRTLIS